MLKVSILQRMRDNEKSIKPNKLYDRVQKMNTRPLNLKGAVSSQISSTKENESNPPNTVSKVEEEVLAEELKQIDNSKCTFSFNKKRGEVTCSVSGRFSIHGNPTKKCDNFPCSLYEGVVKGIKLVRAGADQFGPVEGGIDG